MEVKAEYPENATKALKSLLPFPTSFLCEAGFSAVIAAKTKLGSRLDTSNHISGVTVSHHSQMGQFSCRKTSLGLPLSLHYGELCNYLIRYHNVIIIETECTKKCNALQSSPNHLLPSLEKLSSVKWVPDAKKAGDCWYRNSSLSIINFLLKIILYGFNHNHC